MAGLAFGLAALVWLGWLGRAGLVVARIYQIEEYEAARLLAWGRQRLWLAPPGLLAGAGVTLLLGLAALALPADLAAVGGAGAWLAGGLVAHLAWRPLPAKKALVYTARLRRILGGAAGLTLLVAGGLVALAAVAGPVGAAVVGGLAWLLAPGLALGLVLGGNLLLAPVEAAIRRGFVRRARARLAVVQPLSIGVAGSYGKTSTKHILAHLLAPSLPTLATPKSFNTLLGIVRTINEHLEPGHRLFVVEMDAYAPGEIAAMCGLVAPRVGVITSVGVQHLERFGDPARIADALYELVAALPAGAPAVIHGGEPAAARLAERARAAGYTVVRYGLADETAGPLEVVASAVRLDDQATHFTWRWAARDLTLAVSIPLLGRHNILNVSAALAVVALLDLPVAAAAEAARTLEPVPHRLQRLPTANGLTIIDDSYNANPVGVHNGLAVLEQLPGRTKILVTPGLVELGQLQEPENRRFGEHAARVCQRVILVGARQTAPIYQGLRAGGLAAERIHVVQTLDEVTATLGRIAGPGDVVLFANDLPDSYLELP